jgi:hypothetical protein
MVKLRLADYVQDSLSAIKNQAKIESEPDPEEKDERGSSLLEERQVTQALYESIIRLQYDLEQNKIFNVQLSGTTVTSVFFSGN